MTALPKSSVQPDDCRSEAHLILDSNILIHYPALDGYDWRAKVPEKSQIFLHMTEPVLDEIAKKKDMGDTKWLRKRCNRLVKRIAEFIDSESRPVLAHGEQVIIDPAVPRMELFPELNSASADDRLLACALSFERNSGQRPIIVTADVSLSLRAKLKGHRLQNLTLPEADRLPLEPDPDEIEKPKLQQRIEVLTASQPKLAVEFKAGGPVLKVPAPRVGNEDLYGDLLQKERDRVPFATLPTTPPGTVSMTFFNQAEVDTYNESLENYFGEYEDWLRDCKEIVDRSYDVIVAVSNIGSGPALGVHLWLHFPDGLNLPEKPRDWLSRISDSIVPITRPMIPDIKPVFASEYMSIKKTNSFEVEWDAKKIRQGETKILPQMVLVYDAAAFSCKIPFKIVADNLPNSLTGSLHVHATSDQHGAQGAR